MHHMSRAGVSGDSTTAILYSAVQHGRRNAIGAGFFILMNGGRNLKRGKGCARAGPPCLSAFGQSTSEFVMRARWAVAEAICGKIHCV